MNTTTPDGYYVDENGVWDGKESTIIAEKKNLGSGVDKGWEPIDIGWKFKQEDGWMLKDTNTPDGYHVDANGVWDGNAVTANE